MKIYMTRTQRGTPNGFDLVMYQQSQTYDVPRRLAARLVSDGAAIWAEPDMFLASMVRKNQEMIAMMHRKAARAA